MINPKELLLYTSNLNILFVEDHDDLRETTTEILKKFFNHVDSSPNGKDALTQYNSYYKNNFQFYDIVISDIQLPKLNGVELTQKIYAINPTQAVIILSAYDESKYLLPLVNIGIEYFIKKPIDYQDFLEVLLTTSKKLYNSSSKSSLIKLSERYFFDLENNYLINDSNIIYLTKYEIIFMKLLSSSIGKIYSNEDIVIYYQDNNTNIDIKNIRKLVSKLRKKLPEKGIESIYGIGYRLLPCNSN